MKTGSAPGLTVIWLFHLKNTIWRKALHTNTQADWLSFRQMRNNCTQSIRKAKVSYFKEQFTICESNPKKFWKIVKSLRINPPPHSCACPLMLMMWLLLKKRLWLHFNYHFIESGFLFDSAMPPCPSNTYSSPSPSNATSPDASPISSSAPLYSFCLKCKRSSLNLTPTNIWVRWFRSFLL